MRFSKRLVLHIAISTWTVVSLAACGGSRSSPTAPVASGSEGPGSGPAPSSQIPGCTGTGALFDALPIDIGSFMAFRPLGFVSLPIHILPAKHSAFSMTPPGSAAIAVPVRAPGRVWVKEILEARFSSGARNYQVFVYPCSEVRAYFGHLATLTDRLMTEMAKVPASCNSFPDVSGGTMTTCRHDNMSLPLESGEQFGSGPDTAGVDFGVVDFRRPPAAFIRLDHYDYYYPLWASPLDYFRDDVRSALASKTGHVFGTRMRTASPIGGTHMQDVPGTAQGNWFRPGIYWVNSPDLSSALALVSDYVEPSQPIIAAGNSIAGLSMGPYSFNVENQGLINRAFRDVRPDGNTYCYDRFLPGPSIGGLPLGRPGGVLLISMPGDATLRAQLVPGSLCAAANRTMTSAATSFER